MKKIIFIFTTTLILFNTKAQNTATLLFNWKDTTLVGSWAYNNTYNECWGVTINDREFAIIGSTEGTHIFDITNPYSSYEVAFIQGG